MTNWIEAQRGSSPPSRTPVIVWLEQRRGSQWEPHWYRNVLATTATNQDGSTSWFDTLSAIEIPNKVVRYFRYCTSDDRQKSTEEDFSPLLTGTPTSITPESSYEYPKNV